MKKSAIRKEVEAYLNKKMEEVKTQSDYGFIDDLLDMVYGNQLGRISREKVKKQLTKITLSIEDLKKCVNNMQTILIKEK